MAIRLSLILTVTIAILSQAYTASAAMIQFREDSLPDGSYQGIAVDMRQTQGPSEVREPNDSLFVGRIKDNDNGRTLLGFDISSIPSGSTINSITLTLTKRTEDNGSGTSNEDHTITIHELVGTVDENNVTGPTWTNRDANAPTAWASDGGDFNATVLSSYTGNAYADAVGSQYVFPSSANFVARAQNALDGSGTLYMLLLSADSEADNDRGLFQFWSDDIDYSGETPSHSVDEFPLLEIDYTPIPEPASFALLGLATLSMLLPGCRRKR